MEKNSVSLQIVNPHSAGIDIGSRMHVVAVDQNVENVRSFGVYTKDHLEIISYLQSFNITTVAMEYGQLLAGSFQ